MIPKFEMCDSCKKRKELRRKKVRQAGTRYQAARYQENRGTILKRNRDYRRANLEKIRAAERKSRLKRKAARAAAGDVR